MDEFRELLESVPNSYSAFVDACIEEFGDDEEKRNILIDYIKSRDRENPSDIVEFMSDMIDFDEDDEDFEDDWDEDE